MIGYLNNEQTFKGILTMIGRLFDTNTSGVCKIVDYTNSENVEVEFLVTGYVASCTIDNLRRGKVKDYLTPSVYGVGVLGESFDKSSCDRELYTLWRNMLKRCYSEGQHVEQPTYKDCVVSDNFKNFQYFSKWCNNQIGFKQNGYQLDKDILVKGNKVYSEDTCVFVPKELNLLLVSRQLHRGASPVGVNYHKRRKQYRARCNKGGINIHLGWFSDENSAFQTYKQVKEAHIKEVANQWKGKVDQRVYTALMNYQVEITD